MEEKKYQNLEKEIKELKKIPGQVRAEYLGSLKKFILNKEGKSGYAEYKDTLKHLGIDIDHYENKKNSEWIPKYIANISSVVAIRIFNWDEEIVFELGKLSITFLPSTKVFLKYFSSIKKTLRQITKKWKHYSTQGEFEIKKLDEKNQTAIVLLKDYPVNPMDCVYTKGMIASIMEISTGSKRVKIQETKCPNRGDSYHEFSLEW